MKEVTIGDKTLRLRGSALSLLHYQQEFGRDLLGDLVGMFANMTGIQAMQSGKADLAKMNLGALDSVAILRLIWTLARTDAGPTGKFPSFMTWLAENEDINVLDSDLLQAVFEEAKSAFFRPKPSVAPAAQKQRK